MPILTSLQPLRPSSTHLLPFSTFSTQALSFSGAAFSRPFSQIRQFSSLQPFQALKSQRRLEEANVVEDTNEVSHDLYGKVIFRRNNQKPPTPEGDADADSLSFNGDTTAMPCTFTRERPPVQLLNEACSEENAKREHKEDSETLQDHKMIRVCDKLIDVFMVDKPTTTDWRRLLAFSKEWSNIRPHFFRCCEERADAEQDPGMKHKLLRLSRKLKEIDEDVQKHNELLEVIKGAASEISPVVARRRKDFTKEFFVHLHTVAESYYDNPTEQNTLAKLGNACLAAVQAYDTASESIEALNAAELKFQDIINSPSIDVACKKIDTLAEKKELDSALMLMLTKAYSASKESNLMKDEVKDILYHLYSTARGNLQRLMPKEVRILKYLLTVEDREEQLRALTDAFTPGVELEGKDVDDLYTTPDKLHTWITTVVNAYNFSREGTLIREARDLMNPKIIQKLEELKKLVEKSFM